MSDYWLDLLSLDFWARIGVAVLAGAVVGVERQLRGKPAGMRTSILICLGTAVFVSLGVEVQGEHADPTRVVGQVVTGIGFLGAGVILTRDGMVHGVTSAAVIWILAGIGSAVGFGRYGEALALTAVALVVLVGIEWAENAFGALRRGVHGRRRAVDTNQSH